MWIGVISETSGILLPTVLNIFDGVDYILHCGGIGSPQLLEELSHVAPINGVIGPGDSPDDYMFKKTLHRRWFDVGIYIIHKVGDPMNLAPVLTKDLEEAQPEVVLFGHGGESYNNRHEGRLFFNPGSAGKRRMRFPRSVGLVEIEGHSVRAEVVPLEE